LLRYTGRRLLLLIPVVLGVITIAFFLMHMSPGDPARNLLGPKASQHTVDLLRHQWGLDRSLGAQYLAFLGNTVTGRFGDSYYFNSPISQLLGVRLPVTLLLMLIGAVFAVVIAVPLSVASTTSRYGYAAGAVRGFNALIQGMPTFFVGSILILFLGLKADIFPAGGYPSGFGRQLWALVLPALTVALGIVPLLVRSLNAAMIEISRSEFVAFGRAKGLDRGRIMLHYIIRNSSIAGVSILGIQVAVLAGGTLVVEQVFALPGMGSLLMTAILNRDYPVVQACTLAFAILVVLIYLATDLAYAALDARVRATQ
jgi:peptide/nickel transport system permease protein